jgi:hypothetical protein
MRSAAIMHDHRPHLRGHVRLARGHRHVGGHLGQRDEGRHYAIAGAVAAVLAAGISAYATYESGQAQQQAALYQAKVQRNQAIAAQQAADQAATQDRERTKRIMSANIAALGASGIQPEGSPLLALIDQAQQGELNARTIETSGAREATGFRSQALLSNFYARQSSLAGTIGGVGTFATGALSAYRHYEYGQSIKTAPVSSVPDYGGGY